ncbi:MAG: DNA-3-methyladenine glycosylase [Leptospirillum sp. Group II 'C75']|nr:DNA-3-methyladenine glycosylase [Leptospirillum sp. Group II 'CF-1']EAY57091.1 MAG: DNA-3-methyladenine glycosylase [Leptospirillum rubarum]EIJ75641.1 MAG: DNA-3-methyladenine glycosylase [Leptospirillum sp. Group II 'C75']
MNTPLSAEQKKETDRDVPKLPGTIPSPGPGAPLERPFYDRDTCVVARELLGKLLVRRTENGVRIGRIVEVEAYLGSHDRASHSSRGLTPRTRIMFGPPGFAYVYLIYGMHSCMNVVTEAEGHGAAVLIRAVEPVRNLLGPGNGPGRLCRALEIDRTLNGLDLTGGILTICPGDPGAAGPVVRRPRVGVEYAGVWARRLLRFYLRGNPHVSRP